MDKSVLEFLFVGPLFSIYKALNKMGETIMGLRDDLLALNSQVEQYNSQLGQNNTRLATITGELKSDFQTLLAKLANVAVPEDVSDVLNSLAGKLGGLGEAVQAQSEEIGTLEGLDIPNDPEPETPAPVEDSPGEPAPADPTPVPDPAPETPVDPEPVADPEPTAPVEDSPENV